MVQYPQINHVIYRINKRKNKNHIIITIDAEKEFDKIQHPFMIKSQQSWYGGNTSWHNEDHLLQPAANGKSNSEKLKDFPLKSRIRQGCLLLPLIFNLVLKVLATAIRKEKRNKRHQNWKERSKTIIFCRGHETLYVLRHFSHVQLFVTPWTVACQAPLSLGFFPTRILEWVAMSSSRASSWPRDWTHVTYISCTAGRFFCYWATGETWYSIWKMLKSLSKMLDLINEFSKVERYKINI